MIEFTVDGPPCTQGSMRSTTVGGRRVLYHDNAKLVPWRRRAFLAARDAMVRARVLTLDGPVSVDARFVVERPKSAKKRAHPHTKPDLDKLCRALGDALTGVVVTDDSRIVEWRARKEYGEPRTEVRVEVVS